MDPKLLKLMFKATKNIKNCDLAGVVHTVSSENEEYMAGDMNIFLAVRQARDMGTVNTTIIHPDGSETQPKDWPFALSSSLMRKPAASTVLRYVDVKYIKMFQDVFDYLYRTDGDARHRSDILLPVVRGLTDNPLDPLAYYARVGSSEVKAVISPLRDSELGYVPGWY